MKIHFLVSQSNFRQQISKGEKNGRTKWTCPKGAKIGERAVFIILGEGVLATGLVDSVPKPSPPSWGFANRYCAFIKRIEMLAAPVPLSALIRRFPKWLYPTYPRSYASVASPLAEEIAAFIARSESAVVDDPAVITEGAPKTVSAIQYERSRKARQRCLDHWGCRCIVCGISFGEVYGSEFSQCIHVHHLELVASRKRAYLLNPVKDLRPLCPNCHAVAHKRSPPYSVSELKKLLIQAQRGKT